MQAFPKGCNVVVLDPDVAQVFPDSESVTQALRALAGIIVRKDPSLAVRVRKHAKQLVGRKPPPEVSLKKLV